MVARKYSHITIQNPILHPHSLPLEHFRIFLLSVLFWNFMKMCFDVFCMCLYVCVFVCFISFNFIVLDTSWAPSIWKHLCFSPVKFSVIQLVIYSSAVFIFSFSAILIAGRRPYLLDLVTIISFACNFHNCVLLFYFSGRVS